VLALVMAAALAAPPATGSTVPAPPAASADTVAAGPTTRMPGTWMRLGDTEFRILSVAQFPVADGQKAPGVVLRQGAALWFGLSGHVVLRFRAGHLDQAEFTIDDVAPYQVDYVRDQLRLAGYRASCEDEALQLCDWTGHTHVRFELRDRKLLARITPALPQAPPPRPRPASPARRDTVAVFPQVFVLGRGAPAGIKAPALADSTPLVSPAYPPRAREAGVQGRIWVRALVDTNGMVMEAAVLRSIPELDSAAVAVARRCRFRPYAAEGAPVRFRVEIPVRFTAP
jgi:TonB family protein